MASTVILTASHELKAGTANNRLGNNVGKLTILRVGGQTVDKNAIIGEINRIRPSKVLFDEGFSAETTVTLQTICKEAGVQYGNLQEQAKYAENTPRYT